MMKKLDVQIEIIKILLFLLPLFIVILGCIYRTKNPCYPLITEAKVLTVYYQPKTNAVEKFKGKAEIISGYRLGKIVEYNYHLGGTISEGDIIVSKSGCGYLNQPFR